MFYLTMLSTHFIYGYMVKDHSDSKRKPTAATFYSFSLYVYYEMVNEHWY